MTDQHYNHFSACVQDDWYLVKKEKEGGLHPDMGTLHLDKPKPRGSYYFGAMNQRKQEPRTYAYLGAMHLDNQFLKENSTGLSC